MCEFIPDVLPVRPTTTSYCHSTTIDLLAVDFQDLEVCCVLGSYKLQVGYITPSKIPEQMLQRYGQSSSCSLRTRNIRVSGSFPATRRVGALPVWPYTLGHSFKLSIDIYASCRVNE